MEKKDKFQYAKVILSACLMVGASMGLCFYAAGVFYDPVSAGLGISLGQVSMTTAIMLVFMALMAIFVPRLLKTLPFETVLLVGTALCAGSILACSFCTSIVPIYVFTALMGCGAAMIGMVPATTLINNWFEKRKNWTTSVVLAGSALSAAVFSPAMSAIVTTLGWRMGLVIQAVFVLALMLPSLLWKIQLHPATVGAQAYGIEEAQIVEKHRIPKSILMVFAIIAVLSACLVALPMHFSTLAISIGQSALTGAAALSWCMIGNLVFKLLGGFLSDKLKPVITTGILTICAMIGTIGFLIVIGTRNTAPVLPLAFLLGSVYALSELSLPLLVSNRVGRRNYSVVYALLNFVSLFTTAVAITVVGFMYDGMQSYLWIYIIALVEEVVILLVVWYLIHDTKADDLVINKETSSFIASIREATAKRKAEREQKRLEMKEKEEQEKAQKEQEENLREDELREQALQEHGINEPENTADELTTEAAVQPVEKPEPKEEVKPVEEKKTAPVVIPPKENEQDVFKRQMKLVDEEPELPQPQTVENKPETEAKPAAKTAEQPDNKPSASDEEDKSAASK